MEAVQQIFSRYVRRVGANRVRVQDRVPFGGRPGHYYFVNHQLTPEELAQVSSRSHDAEAVLLQVNDAFIVKIGNIGVANASFYLLPRNPRNGIVRSRWIAHTHPLEQQNAYDNVSYGPTSADFAALESVYQLTGQSDSLIVVCRGGQSVRVVTFAREVEPTLGSLRIEP